jgi:DNA repair ATPase RecN
MALTPAEQQRLNNLIQEGIQLARQLNDTQQQSSFQNFTGSLTDAERLVSSLRDEWKEYTQDVAGTALNFARIVDEIKDMNSGVKRSQQAFSSLSSLAQTLQSHQEGISKLSSKEIKNLKDKVKNKISELNLSKQLLEDQLSQQNLSTEEQIKAQTAINNIKTYNSIFINIICRTMKT